MREGRRQRLGLQEGTEGTVEDTYLDRILEEEGPRTLALDPDAFVDTRDQRYVQDAYNYYLGGGFPEEPEPVIDTPVIDTTPVVDAGGDVGQDQATGDSVAGFDPGVTPGPSGFIGLDPDMDVDPQDFAQEDYGMYETPGGQATPGAEFADQNPYGGTGTLDDLGADTFDDFNSGPQPGISNPRAPGQDTVTQDTTTINTTPTAPPGILNPYQEPMTQQDLIDSDANVGFVEQTFEADDIDEQGNLLEKGIAKIESLGFNPSEIAGKFALNSFIGKPITLAFDAVKAVAGMLPDGIAATTDKAREIGLIQGDNTVTQDIYGINTQSMFGDYNQYNIDRVEQLEDKVNKTPRDITELQQRKDYIESSGALGDIDDDPTGDAEIATETIGTLPEITEARQEQGEYIQEIKAQPVVQAGSQEARDQQDNTGVANVSTGIGGKGSGGYQTSSGDVYASAAEAAEKGDGGGSSGGKGIVCTMMNDFYGFGSFRNKIWLEHSKSLAPEYQKGYHKIFLPLVAYARKDGVTNKIVRKTLEHIAVHRTIDIRQEARGKMHLLGRVYRKILEPICYIVGKHAKR